MMRMDVERLQALVEARFLSVQRHPSLQLLIWNYTAKTQFERYWTAETITCRGLITRPDGTVVARPFPKFWNYTEVLARGEALPVEPFEVTEKVDGSLGILYATDEGPAIATRGSFTSEQAMHATRVVRQRYAGYSFDPALTYLFEIVYPANQIVVNYGELDDLILLAVIETASGQERAIHGQTWPFPIAQRYDGITDLAAIQALGRANQEGFVVRFLQSQLRVKIKLAEYVRLHRLLTGISARTIWDCLSTGTPLEALLDRVPDEFYAWVVATRDGLLADFVAIEAECQALCMQARALPTRREQAALIGQSRYAAVIFKMLDDKPYAPLIWKLLYPKSEHSFRQWDAG
jgi:RNA ligase